MEKIVPWKVLVITKSAFLKYENISKGCISTTISAKS